MSPLVLKPTTTQLGQAKQFASTYEELGYGKNVLQVSQEEYIHFIRIGKLCEIVFIDYLRSLGIQIFAEELLIPHAGNHKKGADFILAHSMQEVDIKAANKPFHKRILIREDQFQAHIHDIYIGAKYIEDHTIEYHGYITGEELKNVAVLNFGHGPCRAVVLATLKPIHRLINLCNIGEKIS